MIRICNLSGQITLENDDIWFAFFDTISDRFLVFDDTQVWAKWEEFETDYNFELNTYMTDPSTRPIERFKSLYDDTFPGN